MALHTQQLPTIRQTTQPRPHPFMTYAQQMYYVKVYIKVKVVDLIAPPHKMSLRRSGIARIVKGYQFYLQVE